MMASTGEEEKEERKWHLDKRLNVSHLLTTLTLAAGLVIWASAMDKRVAVLEEKASTQRIIDDRQDTALVAAISAAKDEVRGLRDDLRELGRKLDRVIESGQPRRHSIP